MSEGPDKAAADIGLGATVSMRDLEPIEAAVRNGVLAFPTVAVGASAGGLEALSRFFAATPADSGCAYVVMIHLAPDRESMLVPLLQRVTVTPVRAAVDGAALQPDHIYVGPPGCYFELHGGCIALHPVVERPPRPTSIDRLMISLAADQRDHAIGVVLSGADGDGTLGIKAIRSEGGLTIAQSPEQAAHPGMPLSAIDTGLVDQVLAAEEIPAALVTYARLAGLRPGDRSDDVPQEVDLAGVLDALRVHHGIDFRGYKVPMLTRRVRRRMGLRRMQGFGEYLETLRGDTDEIKALAADFLISVTEFFREPEAWEALALEALPGLLEGKEIGESVRAWVPACATGEEAYSLAMLLLEHPLTKDRRLQVQVFGTDVDRPALDTARRGEYPHTVEHTVAPQRLRRFFQHGRSSYQVRKELREAVTFAVQNLVTDPPFSHLDLISCRNLLIYMDADLQRRILRTFHFALESDGVLALGKSETVGPHASLFSPVSQRARIYRRIGTGRAVPLDAAPLFRPPGGRPPEPGTAPALARSGADYGRLVRDALLQQHGMAAVLIDREGQVLYFYGPVQGFAEQPEGSPTSDLFSMLRHDLRPHLRAAVHRASNDRCRVETLAPGGDGTATEAPVRLGVSPIGPAGPGALLLVTFERLAQDRERDRRRPEGEHDPQASLHALEYELSTAKHDLRATIVELASANELLQVANEEAMSTNEELQSANEALQTSKEELQSVNEELSTVNAELQDKVGELEAVNNDLGNLLASTHLPTLFLDRGLKIKRFTPAASELFSLLPGDVNRPLTDIASVFEFGSLLEDARKVLHDLVPLERETRSASGRHYLRRTLPYRTQDDRIDGIVVTFVDVSELKRGAEGLQRLAAVMQGSNDAIIVHDLDGRLLLWNASAVQMYGYPASEVLDKGVSLLLPEQAREPHRALVAGALKGERNQGADVLRRHRDGTLYHASATVSVIQGDDGKPTAVAWTERDITPTKRAQELLRESEQRFRALADSAPVVIWMSDVDGEMQFVNQEFERFSGLTKEQLGRRRWFDLLHPSDVDGQRALLNRGNNGDGRTEATVRLQSRGGEFRWMRSTVRARHDASSARVGLIGTMVDVHELIGIELTLRTADRRKDEFIAMLGHELRNPLVPIRNAAEVLNRLDLDDARVDWVRDTLVRQVAHVTRLVDDLLDISLLTRGKVRLQREPLDLLPAIQRSIETVRPLIERKKHRLSAALPAGEFWVDGDPIRLMQVFENLLTNAAKYTGEGGEVAIEALRTENRVTVRVCDNGLGIAPAMHERIFELFVQDERAVDRSEGGLGIGLALARHLVELHGGVIRADSEGLGRGSEFVVELPLLADPTPCAAPPDEEAPDAPAVTGRVLVVDDDSDGGSSLVMLLNVLGYAAELALHLEGAMEVARRLKPRVVLMDIAMPRMNGYEVANRLQMLQGMGRDQVSYLALSGFGRAEDVQRSTDAGFAHHLVKPVEPDELDRLLKELLTS
jgi:two-component system, chemotaxis family, CheB/CheR fusion protein